MECWRELFDIFLNSATPESDASLWLQSRQSFAAASSSPSSTVITTVSFLSLLTRPTEAIVVDESLRAASSPSKSVMWIQTLPPMVQARILSFLVMDHRRFCARDLCSLAKNVLGGNGVDFWVKRAARHLLDVLLEPSCDLVSGICSNSDDGRVEDEFDTIPVLLKDAAAARGSLFPWLPVMPNKLELDQPSHHAASDDDSVLMTEAGDNDEMTVDVKADPPNHRPIVPLKPEVCSMAETLKGQLLCFESTSRTIGLAAEIRNLSLHRHLHQESLQVLGLIEPWRADDQTAAILLSHITKTDDDELGWPSQVLCSIILPKLLILEEPASRVLITATVEYCKQHQRAAAHVLLFPLLFRNEGINQHLCDIITKIITECLHPAHASVFFQRLLTTEASQREFLTLPCHQYLISETMVWTESTFSLFKNALDHNIHLTQISVDHVVQQVIDLAEKYPKSLKFSAFLLSLVTKCRPTLTPHKHLLSESVARTSTMLTKSIRAKLASI